MANELDDSLTTGLPAGGSTYCYYYKNMELSIKMKIKKQELKFSFTCCEIARNFKILPSWVIHPETITGLSKFSLPREAPDAPAPST